MSATPPAGPPRTTPAGRVARVVGGALLGLAAALTCVGFYFWSALLVFGSGSCGEPFDRAAADRGRLKILGSALAVVLVWLVPTLLARRRSRALAPSALTGIVVLVVLVVTALCMPEDPYRHGWCF